MKKHEALKYAYDNYPKGTKYNNLGCDGVISISSGVFHLDDYGVRDTTTNFFVLGTEDKWAEIITDKPKSILDGKVAIQVSNEREFKLLMEHYESKGWRAVGNTIATEIDYNQNKPKEVAYCDRFSYMCDRSYPQTSFKDRGHKIIHFADFAAEIGIEVPKFIMKSEDGVDLYDGDGFHEARLNGSEWNYFGGKDWILNKKTVAFNEPEMSKAFSTQKSAESWCNEQNKPKKITIHLGGEHLDRVFVFSDRIIIKHLSKAEYILSSYEMKEIFKAYQSLQ